MKVFAGKLEGHEASKIPVFSSLMAGEFSPMMPSGVFDAAPHGISRTISAPIAEHPCITYQNRRSSLWDAVKVDFSLTSGSVE